MYIILYIYIYKYIYAVSVIYSNRVVIQYSYIVTVLIQCNVKLKDKSKVTVWCMYMTHFYLVFDLKHLYRKKWHTSWSRASLKGHSTHFKHDNEFALSNLRIYRTFQLLNQKPVLQAGSLKSERHEHLPGRAGLIKICYWLHHGKFRVKGFWYLTN